MASDLLTGLLESSVHRMMLSGYTRRRAFQAISKLIELTVKDYAQSGRKSRPGPLLQNAKGAAALFLDGLEDIDAETADDYIRYARQTLRTLGRAHKERGDSAKA
jgi:predicted RNase H-like HicB family nuclease